MEPAIEIEASPRRIWPYLTEPEQLKRWIPKLSSIELISGRTLSTGDRGCVAVRSTTIECELLEYDPPREMTAGFWRDDIDALAVLGIRLEPVGTRTRLVADFASDAADDDSNDNDIAALALLDPMSLIMRPMMRVIGHWSLDRHLKRLRNRIAADVQGR